MLECCVLRSRLKYTPTPTRKEEANGYDDEDDTPLRKRRRVVYNEEEYEDYAIRSTSKGEIVVSEVCPHGSFIKLHNKSKEVRFFVEYFSADKILYIVRRF